MTNPTPPAPTSGEDIARLMRRFQDAYQNMWEGKCPVPHLTSSHVLFHVWTILGVYQDDPKQDSVFSKASRVGTCFLYLSTGIFAKAGAAYNGLVFSFYKLRSYWVAVMNPEAQEEIENLKKEAHTHVVYALIDVVVIVAQPILFARMAGSLMLGLRPALITDPREASKDMLADFFDAIDTGLTKFVKHYWCGSSRKPKTPVAPKSDARPATDPQQIV